MGGNASKPELDDLETASLPTAVDRVAARRRAIAAASQIGRFVVLHKLGEGGMGTVYAAYDPRLDRKVAIKVVRPDRRGSHQTSERLLKEAQAMARLSHPNIVGVLEAGELGDDVYIALEYVDGVTLRQWLRETPRSWREVVAAFVEAGRGIDAVHAAGLVHRDFKPDNVLVRRDGRIQVSDFGVVGVGVAVGSGSSCELVEHPRGRSGWGRRRTWRRNSTRASGSTDAPISSRSVSRCGKRCTSTARSTARRSMPWRSRSPMGRSPSRSTPACRRGSSPSSVGASHRIAAIAGRR